MNRKFSRYAAGAVAVAAGTQAAKANIIVTQLNQVVGTDGYTDVFPDGSTTKSFDVANNTDGVWLKNNATGIQYASASTTPATAAPVTTGLVGPLLTYSPATNSSGSLNTYLTNTSGHPTSTPFVADGSTQYLGFEIPASGGGYHYGDLALTITPNSSNPADFTTTLLETRYNTTLNAPVPTTGSTGPAPLTILPLGDSITSGGGVNLLDNGGYRTQMVTNLNAAGLNNILLQGSVVLSPSDSNTAPILAANGGQGLHHEGHAGYTISQIDNNLLGSDPTTTDNNGGYWLNGTNGRGSAASTNIVLLHIGTNDILQLYGSHSEADPISDSDLIPIEARMTKLMNDLRADMPNTKLLVSNIIPIPDGLYDSKITGDNITFTSTSKNDYELNHYVLLYDAWIKNTLIPEFASSGMVTFVDQYDSMIDSNGNIIPYSDYGVHPTTAGYDLMGATWANAIEATVPEPTSMSLAAVAALGLLARRRGTK